MIVMPLGVGSATPTADRHLASVALWREGRIFLFDCGENAQMRMLQAGMKRSKIDYILISHLDGDHFFGLPGLLTTMQLQRRDKSLTIIGPKGIKKFVDSILEATNVELCFELLFTEIEIGTEHQVVLEESDFMIEARMLKHGTYCVGYRFQELDKPGKVNAALAVEMGITDDAHFKALKSGLDVTLDDGTVIKATDIVGEPVKGKVFAYITDTEFCENCIRLAENATILYHEATFGQALKDKATETGHCTAQEAAIVAKTANVERLVIGHFSARYTNPFVLLKEAKQVFDETWVATELRPIMTDPAQEKGIFKAVVPVAQPSRFPSDNKRGFSPRPGGGAPRRPGGGGGYRDNRRDSGGGGGYRPRPAYGSGGGGGRYDDRRSSPPPRDYQRRDYRDSAPRDYNRDGGRDRGYYPNDNRRDYPPRDRGDYNSRPPRREFTPRDGAPRDYPPRDSAPRDYTPRDGGAQREYTPRDGGQRDYNREPRREYVPRERSSDNRISDRQPDTRSTERQPDNRRDYDTRQPDSRREFDNNRGRSSTNPMPITPRTPFDEFDRF